MRWVWWILILVLLGGGLSLYFYLSFRTGKGPKERIVHHDLPIVESVVSIPLDISVSRITDALRKKIGTLHFNLESAIPLNRKRNERRLEKGKEAKEERGIPIYVTLDLDLQKLAMTVVGNMLTTNVTYDIKFQAQLNNDKLTKLADCGLNETKPSIKFTLKSKFHVDKSGLVVLENKQWDLDWERPCHITFLDLSVEEILKGKNLKEKFDKAIDDVVTNEIPKAIDLVPILDKTWISLQRPIKLGPDLYLTLNPKNVMLGELTGNGSEINTTISALCTPQLTAGEPDTTEPIKLVLVDSLKASDSIHFFLATALSIDKLNELVNTKMKKKEFPAGPVTVKISRMQAYQNDSSIVFRVRMSRPFFGLMYLEGLPTYDPVNEGIDFTKFDYTVATEEMFGKLTGQVVDPVMIKDAIVKELKKTTDKTLSKVLTKFNDFSKDLKNNITISGGLKRIEPKQVIVSDNQIFLISEVTGVLNVDVNKKTKQPSIGPLISNGKPVAPPDTTIKP